MSACASAWMRSNAATNFSRSSRAADPNSLHGGRCRASSITPSATLHDKALPLQSLTVFASHVPCTLSPSSSPVFGSAYSTPHLNGLLNPVHTLDLIFHARRDHVTLQFSVHRKRPILNRKHFGRHAKCPHLLVMGQLEIHPIQRSLHFFR